MTKRRQRREPTRREPVRTGTPAPGSETRLLVVAGLAIVALTLFVFLPVRHFDFVAWDDEAYVTGNAKVLAGLTWKGLAWAMTAPGEFYWHPLTWLSHMLDVEVYGVQAGGHHVTNLFLHLAGSLALLAALYRLTGAPFRSALVAALFAVHPLHVQPVAWVAERKEVLAGLWFAATLWAYAWYVARPGSRRYVLVAGLFFLGLMSKPMIVTLPVLLLLLDYWPLGRFSAGADGRRARARRLLVEKVPLLALALGSSAVTVVHQFQAGAMRSLTEYPLGLRLENAAVSYPKYIGQALWPAGLAAFYPYPRSISPWLAVVAVAFLAAVSVVAVRGAVRRPSFFVGWTWFIVALLPVIGLVQVGDQAMADRFMYIPLVGLMVMVAWTVPEWLPAERVGRLTLPALAIAATLAFAVVARQQVEYWRDTESLWRRAAAVTSDNQRAHASLGLLLSARGEADEALREFQEAVRIVPGAADLHDHVGRLLLQKGRVPEAIDAFSTAVRLKPDFAEAHNNLGVALERNGRATEAVGHYAEAVRLDPASARARDNLATALAGQGRFDEGIREAREAVRLDPGFTQARNNLGVMLVRAGRPDEAVAQYIEALKVAPGYAVARANLADAYGVSGKIEEAVREYAEALRLEPRHPDWHFKLALSLNRLGDSQGALTHLRAALDLDPAFEPARQALGAIGRATR